MCFFQEAATTSDWGKMRFMQYPRKPWEEILPGLKPQERDLVSKLIVYESGDRLSAEEVCITVAVYVFRLMLTSIAGIATQLFRELTTSKAGPNKSVQNRLLDMISPYRIVTKRKHNIQTYYLMFVHDSRLSTIT